MSFEQYGEYQVDREVIEEFVLESFRANLQMEVDRGEMAPGEAIRIHAQFQRSEAFRQAVDANIKTILANLTERNASGNQPH